MKPHSISPRILYVTQFWPDRASIGAEMRSRHLLQALQQMGTVEVVVMDQEGDGHSAKNNLSSETGIVHVLPVKQRTKNGLRDKLRSTFNPRTNYPNGCGVDAETARQILRRAGEFDLVWFFKLRAADLFPNMAWPRSVVDIDDVPSNYLLTAVKSEKGISQRALALKNLFAWRRREKLLGERFTALTVCSDGDHQYLRNLGVNAPMHIIPNGFEKPTAEPVRRLATPPRIGFIGLFDYPPNLEGIRWFSEKCWPRIKANVPDARLRLVGRGSDGPLKPVGLDIDGLGWLANPSDEIATWSAMIVPIRVGGGTRVKIAQGFSQKCPIVSTALGAYGYGAVDGREMFLADSPEAFADACIKAIRQPEQAKQMAERAWQQFLEKWTWDAIHPRVWAAAEEVLRHNSSVSKNEPVLS